MTDDKTEKNELFDIFLPIFLEEVSDQIKGMFDTLNLIKNNPNDEKNVDSLFRYFHTLKGNSALCTLENLSSFTHSLEDIVGLFRDKKISYSQSWYDLIYDGIYLIQEAIFKIKEDFYSDKKFNYNDFKNKINEFINSNTASSDTVETFHTKEEFVFEQQEIEDYFLKYLTYCAYHATITIVDAETTFADLKMAAIVNRLQSYNISVLGTIPEINILGSDKYSYDIYKNELIILFEHTENANKSFEKVIDMNKTSIKSHDLSVVNLNQFLSGKRSFIKHSNLMFQIVVVSINSKKYAVVCKKIIKIIPPDNIRYFQYSNYNLGFVRYLDIAVPVISINSNNLDKILLFDTVSGIIGLFFDKIDYFQESSYNDLVLSLESNDFIYNYNGEDIKVLFIDNLRQL